MAQIQTYPVGTPVTGDRVPYISNPAGTPALKLANASALGANGLYPSTGDPNVDPTVPSPPADPRALAFDTTTPELDLWRWDSDVSTYTDHFDRPALGTTGPNGGTYETSSNAIIEAGTFTGNTSAYSELVVDALTADVDITTQIVDADFPEGIGIVFRWQDDSDFLFCFYSANRVMIHKYGSGYGLISEWQGWVPPVPAFADPVAGKTLRLKVVGNDFTVYLDGVDLGPPTNGTASSGLNASATKIGLRAYNGQDSHFAYLSFTVAGSGGTGSWVPAGTGLLSDDAGAVPAGGAEGQVLAKASVTDHDTEWVTPATGGGGSANPWALFTATGAVLAEEFDGTSGLTWTPVTPSTGGGHVTWTEANDVMSAVYGSQGNNIACGYLTPHALAVGETVEIAVRQGGASIVNFAGLVIADGATDTSNILIAGCYWNGGSNTLMRDGTLAGITAGVNIYHGMVTIAGRIHFRITRVTTNTWQYASSIDGVSWTTQNVAVQTWTNSPSHVGLAVSAWDGNTAAYGDVLASFDYLRVY